MKNINSICAGIVTFNPDIKRLNMVIDSIIGQLNEVIVVDNHSDNFTEIKTECCRKPGITVLQNSENFGIAKALNQICDYSCKHNYKWVLTMDQDTICPNNIINLLFEANTHEKIGIICPAVRYDGIDLITKNDDRLIEEIGACMTSASLTNLNAWKKVGGYRNDYFIDYVDNEFCMKLRNNGYKILRVNSCLINHQLGATVQRRFLGREFKGTSHSPLRFYYMIRNNLCFVNEYKTYLNLPKEYAKILKIFMSELLISSQRKEMLRYAKKAIIDAYHNKLGKYNESLSINLRNDNAILQ